MKIKLFASVLLICHPLTYALRNEGRKDAELSAVVKLIESHYHVKSRTIPTLAKIGMNTARHIKRLSEYGSAEVAIFEDQDFTAARGDINFSSVLKSTLLSWQLLIESYSRHSSEETLVFTKESGERFKVLVVAIGRRDGTAIQAEISPANLALLLKEPETIGKTLTDESVNDAEPE